MCYALYLFTNATLVESKWDPEKLEMYVQAASAAKDRGVFNWPHAEKNVYYIGSHLGCGCGWSVVAETDQPEEAARKKADRDRLARLLGALKDEDAWLAICWEGDQGKPLLDPLPLNIEDARNDQFEFEELRKYKIIRNELPAQLAD